MELSRFFFAIILLYFFVLIQTTFIGLNLIIITVILWNIFEEQKNITGYTTAFAGGFLLDIFSSSLIGFNILIMLAIALLIKSVIKNYVQIPSLKAV